MDVVKLGGDSLASRQRDRRGEMLKERQRLRQREKGVRGGREREIARENDSSAPEKN